MICLIFGWFEIFQDAEMEIYGFQKWICAFEGDFDLE